MSSPDFQNEEGLIIVIEEKQKGTIDHDGKDIEFDNTGRITIINNTGSPIFDLTLILDGVDKTSLKGRNELTIGLLRHETGNNVHTINYAVTGVPKAIFLSEKFKLPPNLPKPIGYINEKLEMDIDFVVANKWKSPFTFNMEKTVPSQIKIKNVPSIPSGNIEQTEGALKITDLKLDVGDRLDLVLNTEIAPDTAEAFRSGKIKYTYFGDDTTISDIEVKEVRGTLKINSYVDKTERVAERGTWDCYVVVENNTKAEIIVTPAIEVMSGTIVEDQQGEFKWNLIKKHPGLRAHDTIEFEPVKIAPGETKKIGPFVIKSEDEPKTSSEIKTVIIPKVVKKLEGEFTIEDVEVPVFAGVLTKTVKVVHPRYIHGLHDQQLAAHLEETINVETTIQNTGSAKADYIKIEETIPADIIPPRLTGVRVFLNKGGNELILPSETVSLAIEPEDTDPGKEHKLIIEVKDIYTKLGEFFENGDKIIVRYQLTSSNLTTTGKVYEFPSYAEMALAVGTKPFTTKLEAPPQLETFEATRKVIKSKDVLLSDVKDEYSVVILLKNDGDLPVKNYEFVDKIPLTFELIEGKVNPEPSDISETRDGLILKWFIAEIPAKSEFKIVYQVKGRPNHRVSDLYKIYEGE